MRNSNYNKIRLLGLIKYYQWMMRLCHVQNKNGIQNNQGRKLHFALLIILLKVKVSLNPGDIIGVSLNRGIIALA